MTRNEREATIAANMLYEPGMTREALVASLIGLGIKADMAEKVATAAITASA